MPFAVVDAALVAAWCLNYHVIGAMVAACCCHLFVFLMRNWSVDFDGYVGYRRSSQPIEETHVLVTPQQNKGNKMICKIYSASVKTSKGVDEEQFFFHQKQKYVRRSDGKHASFGKEAFEAVSNEAAIHDLDVNKILSSYGGLTDTEVGSLQQRFGPNKYSVPRRSYLKVLFGQLLSPFFVFQVFCISLWALDEYWYYSLVTLAMILMFEMTVSIQRYRSFQEMEQMLKGPYSVCVYRNNAWVQVSSHHIVPGI